MGRVVAAVGLLALAGTAAGQPPYRIDNVHADVVVQYAGGGWQAAVEIDPNPNYPATTFSPNDAILVANPSSITNRSTSSSFDFIGVNGGQPFWHLRQTQRSGQIYLGVNAEGMDASGPGGPWSTWDTGRVFPSGDPYPQAQWVELQVKAVRAPAGGHFSMWQSTDDGPDVFVSTSRNGYQSAANKYYVLNGSHVHYNWGFTKEGVYEIDVVARTFYDAGGGTVALTSDPDAPFTFRFDVVPVPEPAAGLLACAAGGAAVAGVRRVRGRRG